MFSSSLKTVTFAIFAVLVIPPGVNSAHAQKLSLDYCEKYPWVDCKKGATPDFVKAPVMKSMPPVAPVVAASPTAPTQAEVVAFGSGIPNPDTFPYRAPSGGAEVVAISSKGNWALKIKMVSESKDTIFTVFQLQESTWKAVAQTTYISSLNGRWGTFDLGIFPPGMFAAIEELEDGRVIAVGSESLSSFFGGTPPLSMPVYEVAQGSMKLLGTVVDKSNGGFAMYSPSIHPSGVILVPAGLLDGNAESPNSGILGFSANPQGVNRLYIAPTPYRQNVNHGLQVHRHDFRNPTNKTFFATINSAFWAGTGEFDVTSGTVRWGGNAPGYYLSPIGQTNPSQYYSAFPSPNSSKPFHTVFSQYTYSNGNQDLDILTVVTEHRANGEREDFTYTNKFRGGQPDPGNKEYSYCTIPWSVSNPRRCARSLSDGRKFFRNPQQGLTFNGLFFSLGAEPVSAALVHEDGREILLDVRFVGELGLNDVMVNAQTLYDGAPAIFLR